MKRRQLLISLGGLGALGAVGFGAHRFLSSKSTPAGFLVGGNGFDFLRYDIDSGRLQSIPTTTGAHSFLPWTPQPNCYLGIEKSGSNVCLVDFANEKVLRTVKALPTRLFYGHVAAIPGRRELLSSQVDMVTGLGYMVTYDIEQLTIKNEIQIAPGGVHDVAFIDDRTFVFTSSGVKATYEGPRRKPASSERVEKSSLIFFDIAGGVSEKFFLPDESLICGHFKIIDSSRVAIITTIFEEYRGENPTKSGSLWIAERGVGLREIPIPSDVRAKMDFELLSIDVDHVHRRIAATNPRGKMILYFDADTERFLEARPCTSNGVAWNDEGSLLYMAGDGSVVTPSPAFDAPKSKIISSHLFYDRAGGRGNA